MPIVPGSRARSMRRVAVGVAGGAVLGVGLLLIVMPGPAILVIPAGLSLLALEFETPRRWRDRLLALLPARRDPRAS